jgi:hypothetical protein
MWRCVANPIGGARWASVRAAFTQSGGELHVAAPPLLALPFPAPRLRAAGRRAVRAGPPAVLGAAGCRTGRSFGRSFSSPLQDPSGHTAHDRERGKQGLLAVSSARGGVPAVVRCPAGTPPGAGIRKTGFWNAAGIPFPFRRWTGVPPVWTGRRPAGTETCPAPGRSAGERWTVRFMVVRRARSGCGAGCG